jgi:pimeloyl-ACP methyl ester carboxylesterase
VSGAARTVFCGSSRVGRAPRQRSSLYRNAAASAGDRIRRRYDRMAPFEVSIAILNHTSDSHLVLLNKCGYGPPFEKPAERAAQFLAFLKGY